MARHYMLTYRVVATAGWPKRPTCCSPLEPDGLKPLQDHPDPPVRTAPRSEEPPKRRSQGRGRLDLADHHHRSAGHRIEPKGQDGASSLSSLGPSETRRRHELHHLELRDARSKPGLNDRPLGEGTFQVGRLAPRQPLANALGVSQHGKYPLDRHGDGSPYGIASGTHEADRSLLQVASHEIDQLLRGLTLF